MSAELLKMFINLRYSQIDWDVTQAKFQPWVEILTSEFFITCIPTDFVF